MWYALGLIASVTFNVMNINEFSFVQSNWETIGRSVGQVIPYFYLTQRFITVFRKSRNLGITWARYIQSTSLKYILILSSRLCVNCLFCSDLRTKILSAFFSNPMLMTSLTYLILLNFITLTSHEVINVKCLGSCNFLSSCSSFYLHQNILFLWLLSTKDIFHCAISLLWLALNSLLVSEIH